MQPLAHAIEQRMKFCGGASDQAAACCLAGGRGSWGGGVATHSDGGGHARVGYSSALGCPTPGSPDLIAETGTLKTFASFFETEILKKGSAVTLLYRTDGTLDIALSGSERPYELAQARTSLCIGSATLCRALFEAILGQSSIMPGARPSFAAGARQLLESDNIRRDSRRGGSG